MQLRSWIKATAYPRVSSCACKAYLIEMQVPILAISNRLGHEKIQTTMNTYGHLYPNKQRQIADAIEARVKGEF